MNFRFYIICFVIIFCCIHIGNSQDTIFYNTGEIEWIGVTKDTQKIGLWKKFNKSGSLTKEIEYLLKNRFSGKSYKKRYGYLYLEEYNGYIDRNGVMIFDGYYKTYIDGVIQLHYNYKDNVLNGEYKTYYLNKEVLYTKCNYVDGKIDGNYIVYYQSGQIKRIGKYKTNFKRGKWLMYFENGTLESKGKYYPNCWIANQEVSGDFIIWITDKDLNKIEEQEYSHQVKEFLLYLSKPEKGAIFTFPYRIYYKTGIWKYWDEIGNLNKVEKYKKGVLISKQEFLPPRSS